MKIKTILKWFITASLGLPASLLVGSAAMNYAGYCFEQSRFQSDNERMRSGVHGVLGHYSSIRFVHDELPKRGVQIVTDKKSWRGTGLEKGVVLTATRLIPYRDMEEFFVVNPDCCSVTREGLYDEVGRPSLWDKITGFSAGYVNIKFLVRYHDATGNLQSQFSATSYNFTNCGHSVPIY
jgi:hypothetical protein